MGAKSILNLDSDYVWDHWFHILEDKLYVFFLRANKADCGYDPENRHSLAAIGLATWNGANFVLSCQDPVFKSRSQDHWDSLAIWSGSVFKSLSSTSDYSYFSYTSRSELDFPVVTPREHQRPQKIGLARSKNLVDWERVSDSHPLVPTPGADYGLDGVNWRDPYLCELFPGNYQMFVTSRLVQPPEWGMSKGGGAVAVLRSNDIERWSRESLEVFYESEDFYQMEVPQVFWIPSRDGKTKRLYLLFSTQALDISDRRKFRKADQVTTGTYYVFSEKVNLDCEALPPLQEEAQLLSSELYGGKILKLPDESGYSFFGFPLENEKGEFEGGIWGPCQISFSESGAIDFKECE